ncbi:MAG: fumarylacetoacetate hydrolase family protein [Armatimonadota bacterium]
MKLLTVESAGGRGLGAIVPDGMVDLVSAWPAMVNDRAARPPDTMLALIAATVQQPQIRTALRDVVAAGAREYVRPLAGVKVRAPLAAPGKLICVASNYAAHIEESGRASPLDKHTVTPWLFLKPPTTIIGPGEPIPVPRDGQAIDWEVELAAVIGRPGKHIPVEHALDHIFGYTILNDISERKFKAPAGRPTREWDQFFDWQHGKWFDGFAPMGPWLATEDEIADPQALALELRVNGRVRQRGSTSQMIYSVAELVAFASSVMTLMPGDIIATGTPQGVGSATGEFLKPGDVVECEVAGLGLLVNSVMAEDDVPRS